MKTFKACVAAIALMLSVVSVADAASRVSSSRPSYTPSRSVSVSKPTYSAPKATSSNSYNGGSFFSSKPDVKAKPAPTLNLNKTPTAVQSKPTLKSLGFTKPAPVQTVRQPSVSASPKQYVKTPTATTSGGYYGPQYGSSGMGASIAGGALGAFGGMMIYDALTADKQSGMTAAQTQATIDNAKQDQRIEDKLDLLIADQDKRPCLLPQDAPLVMDPKYYCGDNK